MTSQDYQAGWHPPIPGLTRSFTREDLHHIRKLYNDLPDDSQQADVAEKCILELAELFVRNNAHPYLGLHLIHGHFEIPEEKILIGSNHERPQGRWAKPCAIDDVRLSDAHGHIYMVTNNGFVPYEIQQGSPPDLSQVAPEFLSEFSSYVQDHDLCTVAGLQVLDEYCPGNTLELIFSPTVGTVMFAASDLKACTPVRQTGWRFEADGTNARVCQANETHGVHENGHAIFNKGTPHPKIDNFEGIVSCLRERSILSSYPIC